MNDAELAIAVVTAGAEVVRRRFGTALERIDKGGGDFATSADVEAERAMRVVLSHHRPDDAVVGEELGETGHTERTWLIDPLCGTRNYDAQMRVVAVNAALSDAGRLLLGAVADPFAGEVFWSDAGSVYVRTKDGDGPIRPSADCELVDLNFDPPFPNAPAFRAVTLAADTDFITRFKPRVVSSSLALAWVATGRRAAYITDGDVRGSVHFAAGLAICDAAGCCISDLHGRPWGQGPDGLIVAASPETHDSLLRLAKKQRRNARPTVWSAR